MKNSNLPLVVVGVLVLVVLVGGLLLSSRSQGPGGEETPVTRPERTEPTPGGGEKAGGEGGTTTSPVPGTTPEVAADFSADLTDKVGGNRSGRVTVAGDPFTGESKYSITVSGLPKPEGAASYHVWINRPEEGVATDQGKIEVDASGSGSVSFNNVSPKEGWQIRITYQATEDPAPGTIILEGSLKKE